MSRQHHCDCKSSFNLNIALRQVGRRPVALFAMAIDLVAYFCANMAAQTEHQPHWHGDLASSLAPSVCGYACIAGLLDGEFCTSCTSSYTETALPACSWQCRLLWTAVPHYYVCMLLLSLMVGVKSIPSYLNINGCFSSGAARSLIQVLQAATISTLFSKKDSEAAFAMQETWLSVSSILICCVLTQVLPTVLCAHASSTGCVDLST